ncbi:MAG: hypothetical protein ACFUZC_21740 [Chthoniobacteraceae bacterium]
MSAWSSSGSSENCRFACRSALLIGESSDPLHAQVFEALATRLRPKIDLTVARPRGPNAGLAAGAHVPDLIVRLDLQRIERRGIIPYRRFAATFRISMGQSVHSLRQYYYATDSVPLAQTTWGGALNHHSTLIGLSTRPVAETIAAALGDAVLAEIASKRAQYGALPALPPAFYGPYRPTPPLWFPSRTHVGQILSGCGLLRHNLTFWNIEPPEPVADFFREIRDHYVAEGWRGDSSGLSSPPPYLRLTKGQQTLEVFGISEDLMNPRPSHYGARFEEGFSAQESQDVLTQLWDSPLDSQIVFANVASPDQRAELQQRIRESRSSSAAAWFYLSRNQTGAEALRSLHRAKALACLQEKSDLEPQIDEAARKLGDLLNLTADDYREAGYEDLAEGSFEVERRPDQPVLLLDARPDHPVRTISIQFRPAEGTESLSEMRVVQSWDKSRSWSSSKQAVTGESQASMDFGAEDRRYAVKVSRAESGTFRFLIAPAASR